MTFYSRTARISVALFFLLSLCLPAFAAVEVAPYPISALSKPPKYPSESRKLREEGEVLIRALISEDGHVLEVKMDRSSGHERLDAAAIQAISGWVFSPATSDGVPVKAWALYPVQFRLNPGQ